MIPHSAMKNNRNIIECCNNTHQGSPHTGLHFGPWNNFEIIAVFYFTCNRVWNCNRIISATERVLKLLPNYFSDIEHVGKYSWSAINLWNNFEIISGRFPCTEILLFQTDVDKSWNNFQIILLLCPGWGAEYCDQFVCLCVCVCLSACVSVCVSVVSISLELKFFVQIPCGHGPPRAAVHYVMYFRFYGWCHFWL